MPMVPLSAFHTGMDESPPEPKGSCGRGRGGEKNRTASAGYRPRRSVCGRGNSVVAVELACPALGLHVLVAERLAAGKTLRVLALRCDRPVTLAGRRGVLEDGSVRATAVGTIGMRRNRRAH